MASTVVTWLFAAHSSVTNRFFWNGLLCLLSGIVAFLVAISAELQVSWQTGNAGVDELLGAFTNAMKRVLKRLLFSHIVLIKCPADYKIAILLGVCCIVFFFCHSLLVLTL